MTPRRHEALYNMAHADESPRERDRARAILEASGVGWHEPPRRPPTAPADPLPWPFGQGQEVTVTATSNGGTVNFTFRVRVG